VIVKWHRYKKVSWHFVSKGKKKKKNRIIFEFGFMMIFSC